MDWRWGVAVLVGVCSIAQAAPFGVNELARASENTVRRETPPWLTRTMPAPSTPTYLPPLGRFGLPWEEPIYRRIDVRRWRFGDYVMALGTIGDVQTDREGTSFAGEWLFNSVDVPGIRIRPSPATPWELGAGLLVGFRKNFAPGSAWALMTLGRRY